jgi:serine/threonine protein kinase
MRAQTCPTPAQLSDWLHQAAADASSAELEAHIDTCEICQGELKRIESGDLLLADLEGIAKSQSNSQLGEDRLTRITTAFRLAESVPKQYPSRIRDYELLEILGQGGMGTVFLARHTPLNRLIALKILPPDSGQRVERFQRELAHHGPLDHPNIVKALDAGEADGVHFLVTELVEGKNAAQLVAERGPLLAKEACDIARQAALGLAYLHERGLVHRDVKPSNLMVDASGHVRLLDLGLVAPAKEESADDRMTKDKTILGTPDYIAPEQINDPRSVDGRADLYGLGCTLFHLLSGKPPFADHSLLQKLHAHQYEEPDMHRIKTPMAPEFIQLFAQLLAKKPALRPASASTVARQFAAFAPLKHTEFPPIVMPPKPPTMPPTKPSSSSSSGVIIVLAILGILVVLPILLILCAGFLFFFGYSNTVLKPNAPFTDEWNSPSTASDVDNVTEPVERPPTEPAREVHGPGQSPAIDAFRLGAHSQPVTTIAFAPDGGAAYSAGAHQFEPLLTWDLTSRRQADSMSAGAVLVMAVHPTDPNLLLLGVANNLVVWDRTTKKERDSLSGPGIVTSIATSAGVDKVAVGTSSGQVIFWNLKTSERTGSLEYQGAITALAMSPGGGLIVSATDRRQVTVWDAVADKTTGQMTINDQAIALSFNTDATSIYVVEGYSDRHRSLWQRVVKYDLKGAYQFETSIAESGEMCLAAAIRDNMLLIGCADGSIRSWYLDRDIAKFQWRQKIHEQPVTALSISPTGKTAISGARDGSVYLLDLAK